MPGVIATSVGYSGGALENPTYEDVCGGRSGHAEVVEVVYDPKVLPLERLLDAFWEAGDPTSGSRGQYRSTIMVTSEAQREAAEASKAALEASGRYRTRLTTSIVTASTYWRAEEYHQKFYEKRFGKRA